MDLLHSKTTAICIYLCIYIYHVDIYIYIYHGIICYIFDNEPQSFLQIQKNTHTAKRRSLTAAEVEEVGNSNLDEPLKQTDKRRQAKKGF